MTYHYNKKVNPSILYNEIITSMGITPMKIKNDFDTNEVEIIFDFTLNSELELSLNTLVDLHVYTPINEENLNFFFHDNLSSNIGTCFKGINITSSNNNRFLFILPKNVLQLTEVKLICIPNSTGMNSAIRNFTFNLEAGVAGSLYNLYNNSINKSFQLTPIHRINTLSILELFSNINFNVLSDDLIVGVRVQHNGIGGNMIYQGISVKYISK